MKTNRELLVELLQVSQEYQKNITKLLEYRELLEHHLSVRKKEEEVDKLTQGLKVTKDSLKSTQMALQESEIHDDELCGELSLAHSLSYTT
jgi:molecular chaperone GrpE (heat shock protein)